MPPGPFLAVSIALCLYVSVGVVWAFFARIKNYIPILIPLIVNSIRRSLELAEAMESRAWGAAKKRTNLYILKLKKHDYFLAFLSILMLTIALYIRIFVSLSSITQLLSFI